MYTYKPIYMYTYISRSCLLFFSGARGACPGTTLTQMQASIYIYIHIYMYIYIIRSYRLSIFQEHTAHVQAQLSHMQASLSHMALTIPKVTKFYSSTKGTN